MKSRLVLLGGVVCLSLWALPICQTFAHDGSFDISVTDWNDVLLGHDDTNDWKGWANVTVTNSMTEDWGDFHFEIYEWASYNVIFPDTVTMLMLDDNDDPYTDYWYEHVGTQNLDFYFYDNPVEPGETVTFSVWTDNTQSEHTWFGLTVYPTPVPEPGTIALLGLGAIGLLRKRR